MGIDAAKVQHLESPTYKLSGQSRYPPDERRPCAKALSTRSEHGSDALPRFLSLTTGGFLRGHLVSRSPVQLHLHPAVIRMNLANCLVEISGCMERRPLVEPILITTSGIIISGFADWQAAISDNATLDCIEYPLNDEEALQFILIPHRPRPFWNSFSRMRSPHA